MKLVFFGYQRIVGGLPGFFFITGNLHASDTGPVCVAPACPILIPLTQTGKVGP